MNTHFAFLTGTLTVLSMVAPAIAAPPSAPAPQADTAVVAVVREFLADRAAGRYDAAYGLLSPGFRKQTSIADFTAGSPIPQKEAATQPPAVIRVAALIYDTHNTLGVPSR